MAGMAMRSESAAKEAIGPDHGYFPPLLFWCLAAALPVTRHSQADPRLHTCPHEAPPSTGCASMAVSSTSHITSLILRSWAPLTGLPMHLFYSFIFTSGRPVVRQLVS